jgi:hypothetical protein
MPPDDALDIADIELRMLRLARTSDPAYVPPPTERWGAGVWRRIVRPREPSTALEHGSGEDVDTT